MDLQRENFHSTEQKYVTYTNQDPLQALATLLLKEPPKYSYYADGLTQFKEKNIKGFTCAASFLDDRVLRVGLSANCLSAFDIDFREIDFQREPLSALGTIHSVCDLIVRVQNGYYAQALFAQEEPGVFRMSIAEPQEVFGDILEYTDHYMPYLHRIADLYYGVPKEQWAKPTIYKIALEKKKMVLGDTAMPEPPLGYPALEKFRVECTDRKNLRKHGIGPLRW